MDNSKPKVILMALVKHFGQKPKQNDVNVGKGLVGRRRGFSRVEREL